MSQAIIHIGVSGHQQLGNEATYHFVKQQFSKLIREHQEQGKQVVLYSALALGADQLFVRTALELSVAVEVVIPCEQYESIFTEPADRENYHRLLSLCQDIHYLPSKECSDDAYLFAGQWIADHSDLMVLAWNGQPAKGRSGTGDIANYARSIHRPFVHLHTGKHVVTMCGGVSLREREQKSISPKRDFITSEKVIYQGKTIHVNQYQLQMPDGRIVVRDIVERPESVLVLPVSTDNIVMLIEEYDLGAGVWQLTLPGGKLENPSESDSVFEQAQQELRQEIGYKAGRLEKLLTSYSHPGYVSHKVHFLVAYDLEWSPLEGDTNEEIRVHTYTLQEALALTYDDLRCDPEAALALWLYTGKSRNEKKLL
ncbi:NUDIX hydrolase [Ktedonobacter racemifer]|uniref:NUDIX hydrolase n=1 Tax=Ktedonobacter racemifer DSM 44963 TaxID=485913 RepID=D6TQ44_KTERA|nr:NUDIX hydrolase [Ktedonobacter racemifer]EFH85692.1 NUDIX hydrolase [Ktedonobacter racemifer DSM 44963]